MTRPALSAIALTISLSHTALAEQAPAIAEFPAGTFLENLTVAPDGAASVTSYFDRQLHRLGPDNGLSALATLPAHPVSILELEDGYLVAAHGAPFTEGAGFTQTQQILRLDKTGAVVLTIPAPEALFLNGMTRLPNGAVLIADSIAGTIWRFDAARETLSPWLHHEVLTQNPEAPPVIPGANGIKAAGDRVLVSNSGRGALYEIAVKGGAAASNPALVAQTGPIDDFWIDGERIIFTTHGEALKAVEPDGTISTLLEEGCDGCTAVARRDDAYLVLTTGGMLEGGANPARILEIPAPPAQSLPAATRLALPGENHAMLDPLIGDWRVEMRVYPAPGAAPIVSTDMAATRRWILGGRYVQEELSGRFAGNASERLAIIGYNNLERRFELASFDTFEPGFMIYHGQAEGGVVSVEGDSIEAGFGQTPTGRHRDLRFEIAIEDARSIERIFVRYPGEEEFLFVEQIFTPAE